MKLTDEVRDAFKTRGRKGGKAAARRMTAKARKLRARNAANKRWGKPTC